MERAQRVPGRKDHQAVPGPVQAVEHGQRVRRRAETERRVVDVLVDAVAEHEVDAVVAAVEVHVGDGAVAELDGEDAAGRVLADRDRRRERDEEALVDVVVDGGRRGLVGARVALAAVAVEVLEVVAARDDVADGLVGDMRFEDLS